MASRMGCSMIRASPLCSGSVTMARRAPVVGEAINLVFDGYETNHGVDSGHVGQIVGVVVALNVGASVFALFRAGGPRPWSSGCSGFAVRCRRGSGCR